MQAQIQIFGTQGQIDVLAAGTGSVRVQLSDSLVSQLGSFATQADLDAAVKQLTDKIAAIANGQSGGSGGGLSLGDLTEVTSAILAIVGGTGAVVGNVTISVTQADSTHSGYLSSSNWSTFNNKQAALSFGNLTEATSSVLTIGGGTGSVIGSGATIQVTKSDTSHNGYLSSTDWNTFNGKQAAGSYLTDAPSDGTTYGRKNGTWSAASSGGATDVLQAQVFS